MNKPELYNRVAEVSGLSKKEATTVVDAVFQVISEALAAGDTVKVQNFGNFEARNRAARKGRNPQTGQEIDISATRVPAFKAGSKLKEALK